MFEVVILIASPALMQDEFDILLTFVDPEKRERIKRFRFFRDASNALLGDILARIEICRVTGLINKQLEFSANAYGKPFLKNNTHIHYNISHAGHYVALAISNQPVGIDIEVIKHIDLKIAERFFAPDEAIYVLSMQDDSHTQRFFEVWTKKESRIKWEGRGLSKELPSFSVFDLGEQETVFYHQVFRNSEAICYLCSNNSNKPSIRVINTVMLMQYAKCIEHIEN